MTARLVDEVGPDSVTTALIAAELGISIGSIYSYFDDRSAIFDAIVARSIEAHQIVTTATRDQMADRSWFDATIAVIDSLVEAYRTDPGFRALWFSNHLSTKMLEEMRRSDEEQAQHLLAGLTTAGYWLDCQSPIDVMRMYVGLIDKGLDLAFRDDPRGSEAMIAETKKVVKEYVGAYLKRRPKASR